jgi:hypothetical protein
MKHTGIKDTYGTELKLGDTVEVNVIENKKR